MFVVGLAVALPALSDETNAPKRRQPPPLPPMPPQRKFTRRPVPPPTNSSVVVPTVPVIPPPRAAANPAPFTVQPGARTVTPGGALPTPIVAADPNALKWDADAKDYSAKPGESIVPFTFWLTNTSASDVFINSVRTSCGCTVARLPAQPWRIAPGSNGPIEVSVNLAGKGGVIQKGVTVDTSVGIKQLTVKVAIPAGSTPNQFAAGGMGDAERVKNMQLALADRQVVFKNQECAKCHSEPVKGKQDGRLIYAAACGICHDSHLRASAVPDLRALPHPTDAEHWRRWITYGRAGSMMPAFAEAEGGPLTDQQIGTLVDFMLKAFPSRPQPATASPRASAPTAPATDIFSAFPPPRRSD